MNKHIVSRNAATNMKVVFFIVFIAYVQATSEPFDAKKHFEQTIQECVEKHGIDKDHVLKIWSQSTYPEDDKDFSNFYDCVAEKYNMYEPDGEVHFKSPHLEPFIRAKLNLGDSVDVKKLIEETAEHCSKTARVDPRVLNAIRRRNCGVEYFKQHLH